MTGSLLARVMAALDQAGVRYAMAGAGALAAHGVVRSTFDLDLVTTDLAALDRERWAPIAASGEVQVELRRGDADDPLAGVVRITATGERDIDVVVGRSRWQAETVARARPIDLSEVRIPVVTPGDLVLLKLYAGGSQDCWDIDQLLAAREDRDAIITEVESRLDALPADARLLWERILQSSNRR